MTIFSMPIDYRKHHPNWRKISKDIRFNRAKGKCEECGVDNYSVGYREADGSFVPYFKEIPKGTTYKKARQIADDLTISSHACDHAPTKYIVIVLTVAHLDHNTENNSYSNLKALCQKCHLQYDKHQHAKSRKANKAKGQLSIF